MNTVLNIKVGDWVVDNRGDFGRVCRLVFEADLERLQHLKVFSFWSNLPDEMTQTTLEEITYIFKSESEAKAIADIVKANWKDENE